MQFNLSQLLKEPIGATRQYHVRFGDSERPEERWIRGDVEFVRIDDGVLARGSFDVPTESECSRCLTDFCSRLLVDFEEVFQQTVDVETGVPLHAEVEPGGFTIDRRHTVDLGEAIRQYQELAAPLQPLCEPECQGFCPGCGADLREAACTCEEAPVDSRWSVLQGLKSQLDQ